MTHAPLDHDHTTATHHHDLVQRLAHAEAELRSQDRAGRNLIAENARLRQQLADAQELIATYDDVTEQLDRARARYATSAAAGRLGSPAARAQDADLEPWIRRAAADPGSIAGRRRGPSWPGDEEGYAEEQETVPAWIARAVLRVLAKDGQPHCERCSQRIGVNDQYDPPLPGIGLWEHRGDCPPVEDRP